MNNFIVILLCKEISYKINLFIGKLIEKHIDYKIICDYCSLDKDDEIKSLGFVNLTRSPYIKKPSAWDKAFYTIHNENMIEKYKYFFFIEDDVYSKQYESIIQFILDAQRVFNVDFITKKIRPKSHHPSWQHWKEDYIFYLKYPSQSFNPFCRLSSSLITKIFEYQKKYQQFNFHEILFASLCLENNMTYINYIESSILNKYIGNFKYNPILLDEEITDNRIYHPVKNSKSDREKL